MRNLTNVRHFKQQAQTATQFHDWVIIVGEKVHQAYYGRKSETAPNGAGTAENWLLIRDSFQFEPNRVPCLLDIELLPKLATLRLAPENQRSIKIFEFNVNDPNTRTTFEEFKTRVLMNLAENNPKLTAVQWYDGGLTAENLIGAVERIREGKLVMAEHLRNQDQNRPLAPDNPTLPYIEARTHENGTPSLYRVTPKFSHGEPLPDKLDWLADKIDVLGRGRGDGEDFAIVAFTPSHSSQAVKIAVPFNQLGDKTGWQLLAGKGLAVTTKSYLRNELADWITQNANGTLYAVTHSAGWQNGAYVLPNGEILAENEPRLIVRNHSANRNGYTASGTLEEWQAMIAQKVKGNPLMMLSIASAFSTPLLKLLKADSFGVHFFGASTAGKTTTANIGASVWGNPSQTLLTWNGTAHGLENEAHARNDGLLVLDEIGQADKRTVSKTAYTLFNGKGKVQGAKDGGNRELSEWRIVVISTGEQDFETYLNLNDGNTAKVNAGQLVRFLNIPFEAVSNLHGFANAKDHADYLNETAKQQHGTAGRAWARWLSVAENQRELTACYDKIKAKWLNRLPMGASGQVQRVASRFAILETALQLARPLTGWTESENAESVLHCFNLWLADFGLLSKEERQIVEQVNHFLLTQAGARCLEYPADVNRQPPHNTAGYHVLADSNGNGEHFYIFPTVYRDEVINGFNERQASQILEQAKMLERENQTAKGFQVRIPRGITGKKTNIKAYKLFILAE